VVAVALAFAACAEKPQPRSSAVDPPPWSEAGRRAKARWTWHCAGQSPPRLEHSRVPLRARPRERDPGCDYARFLCQQIHRGAKATAAERTECAAYEAVHGAVGTR